MIKRIVYADDDWTRTADVVPDRLLGGWKVWLGYRAQQDSASREARTMQQAQAIARRWITEGTR